MQYCRIMRSRVQLNILGRPFQIQKLEIQSTDYALHQTLGLNYLIEKESYT